MSAARVCIDCLFANVRRQQFPRTPVASCSYPARAPASSRRSYATQNKPFDDPNVSYTSSSPSAAANSAQGTSADKPKASEQPSPGHLTDNARTLALARWSALRQSALQALERQQRDLRQKLGEASARINDISGYKEIEALKAEVTRKELELLEARTAAREAKEAYSAALNDRMASSREVNDLLQRKNNWLESDVLRFTELVRQDHLNESRERDSKIEVTREEEAVERKIGEMMQAILRRYHEEQVWSDKIRSLSTYGTLAITCVNVLIFLLALTLVEPWKRRRMVSEVEGRLKERDEQQITWLDNRLDDLKQLIQSQSQIMRDGHVSRATGAKGTAQSIPAQPYLKLDQLKDEAAIAASELSVPVSLSPRGEEALEPERSKEDTPRDVYYSGAAGILLGAAVVTCWNALFR